MYIILSLSLKMIQALPDGRLVINLKLCGKCRQNLTDLFRLPTANITSLEESYLKLDTEKDLKMKFEEFIASCPRCKETHEDITFLKMNQQELDLIANTNIDKILISRSDI